MMKKRKKNEKDKNLYHHMLEPFRCSKIKLSLADVAIELDIKTDTVLSFILIIYDL